MKKNYILKTAALIKSLYSSDYYVVLLSVLVLIGWISGFWVEFILAMLVLTIAGTLLTPDLRHVLSFLILYGATMSTQEVSSADIALFVTFSVMEAIALVANVIMYKRDFSVLSPSKIKGFTFAHVLLIIPFLLAGAGFNGENKNASWVAAALMLLITALYVFLYVGLIKSERKNFIDYVLKSVFALSLVSSLELLVHLFRLGNIDAIVTTLQNKNLWIGWTGPNTIASIISMGLPCALYFCVKKRKLSFLIVPFCVLIFFVELALIIFSGCRGAVLFSLFLTPSLLLYAMWKTECKTLFFASFSIIFLLVALLTVKYGDSVLKVLSTMINKGMSSSGRVEEIYPEAITLFKNNPLFGVGWGYKLTHTMAGLWQPYLFHSTFFQFLANMGVVGVVFLLIFYLWRYFLVLPMYKNPAAIAVIASILLFDMYSMIDTSFFSPALFIMLDVMSLSMELDMPENRCLAFLGKNPLKFFNSVLTHRK